jgi:hypothetical protein
MPIHDWTRVGAGTFHDFHLAWIAAIRDVLNNGVLPADYYAMAEQIAGHLGPDVLTLQASNGTSSSGGGQAGLIAAAEAAPRVRFTARSLMDEYVVKQRTLVIRHASDDRIVALIEIVSRGNKASQYALRSFLDKATEALHRGYHLLLLDLFPPGRRDPQGIHGAIWERVSDEPFTLPPDKPLTLAAYSAGEVKTAYVEPVAVGEPLADMPLFLEPDAYVTVPLEKTYQMAWHGVPQRWRSVLEPKEA